MTFILRYGGLTLSNATLLSSSRWNHLKYKNRHAAYVGAGAGVFFLTLCIVVIQ